MTETLSRLAEEVIACRRCSRLVAWREEVARTPPAGTGASATGPVHCLGSATRRPSCSWWGWPPPPGGNRTGRIFTGDRSGDWLFASLYRTGWANQPRSDHPRDGLRLDGAYIAARTGAPRRGTGLPPPKGTTCRTWFGRCGSCGGSEVLVTLGAFAWDGALRALAALGHASPRPRPRFGHRQEAEVGPYLLLGCYHPSQQNTFTGVLTEEMTDAVFARAREVAE